MQTERELTRTYHRISSGERINYAYDDAAGMAISGRMESQIRGLNSTIKSMKDGQFLVSAAEGAMEEVTSILQRMREISVYSANGAASESDKNFLQLEVNQLILEIDALGNNSKFNGRNILDGSQTFTFYQDMDAAGATINLGGLTVSSSALDVEETDIDMSSNATAATAISNIDTAIDLVDTKRANLGAVHNRFEHGIDNLSNIVFNTMAAKSGVKDTDLALETTKLTAGKLLQQSAGSMIVQANSTKKNILSLIQQ
jgi:flagellin